MSDNKNKTSFSKENNFYILGEFSDELHESIVIPFTEKIQQLSKTKDSSIVFYINSCGGSSWICMHLVSLFELAKSKGIKIKTVVPSMAFSAGSILAVAGTEGERYIAHNGEHLIHYGEFDGWRKTTPLQIDRNSEFWKRHTKNMLNHYKKYCKIPNLENHLKDDNFFIEAKKCIELKIADKYMEEL
jgi:ATP-dependent protease ClpP protease subunit